MSNSFATSNPFAASVFGPNYGVASAVTAPGPSTGAAPPQGEAIPSTSVPPIPGAKEAPAVSGVLDLAGGPSPDSEPAGPVITPASMAQKIVEDPERTSRLAEMHEMLQLAQWQAIGQGRASDFLNSAAGQMAYMSLQEVGGILRKTARDHGEDPELEKAASLKNLMEMAELQQLDAAQVAGTITPEQKVARKAELMKQFSFYSDRVQNNLYSMALVGMPQLAEPMKNALQYKGLVARSIQEDADRRLRAEAMRQDILLKKAGLMSERRSQDITAAGQQLIYKAHTLASLRSYETENRRLGIDERRADIEERNKTNYLTVQTLQEVRLADAATARNKDAQITNLDHMMLTKQMEIQENMRARARVEAAMPKYGLRTQPQQDSLKYYDNAHTLLIGQYEQYASAQTILAETRGAGSHEEFVEELINNLKRNTGGKVTKDTISTAGPGAKLAKDLLMPHLPPAIVDGKVNIHVDPPKHLLPQEDTDKMYDVFVKANEHGKLGILRGGFVNAEAWKRAATSMKLKDRSAEGFEHAKRIYESSVFRFKPSTKIRALRMPPQTNTRIVAPTPEEPPAPSSAESP